MAWPTPDPPAWMLVLGLAGPAAAAPVVIHDQGPTRPLSDYVALPDPAPAPPSRPPTALRPLGLRFPVRTPELSPGPVAPRSVNLPRALGHPVFLVGSDSYSRAWLARYRDRLRAAGAAGVLVQAETAEDFETMKALAQGLPITAFDATKLARSLGLTRYPVLISAGRIEQ